MPTIDLASTDRSFRSIQPRSNAEAPVMSYPLIAPFDQGDAHAYSELCAALGTCRMIRDMHGTICEATLSTAWRSVCGYGFPYRRLRESSIPPVDRSLQFQEVLETLCGIYEESASMGQWSERSYSHLADCIARTTALDRKLDGAVRSLAMFGVGSCSLSGFKNACQVKVWAKLTVVVGAWSEITRTRRSARREADNRRRLTTRGCTTFPLLCFGSEESAGKYRTRSCPERLSPRKRIEELAKQAQVQR